MKLIHHHIRSERIRRKISVKDFAVRMGIPVSLYRKLESGREAYDEKRRKKAESALNRNESWPDVTNCNKY